MLKVFEVLQLVVACALRNAIFGRFLRESVLKSTSGTSAANSIASATQTFVTVNGSHQLKMAKSGYARMELAKPKLDPKIT